MQTEIITCQALTQDFAESTGLLDADIPPRRYLWTDAFAVCNFLELYRQIADQVYLQLALSNAILDMQLMCQGKHWATRDPLARRKEKFERADHLLTLLNKLQRYCSFQQKIESFWLQPEHQRYAGDLPGAGELHGSVKSTDEIFVREVRLYAEQTRLRTLNSSCVAVGRVGGSIHR